MAKTIDTIYPGVDGESITPANTDITPFNYVRAGTGGTVVIRTLKGTTLTHTNVPDGGYVWCQGDRVTAATTASDIIVYRSI